MAALSFHPASEGSLKIDSTIDLDRSGVQQAKPCRTFAWHARAHARGLIDLLMIFGFTFVGAIAPSNSAGAQTRDKEVDVLINQLASSNEEVRYIAAYELAWKQKPAKAAIPALIAAIGDPRRKNVHIFAAQALGHLGTEAEDAIPALVIALKSANGESSVGMALGTIVKDVPKAVPMVVKALSALLKGSPNRHVRSAAADAFRELGEVGSAGIPYLIEAAKKDPSPSMRGAALSALVRVRAKESLLPSIEALNDPQPRVREQALDNLGLLGALAKEAVPAIVRVLLDRNHQTALVRRSAARALGAVGRGETDGIAALIFALGDAHQDVRLSAVVALRGMGVEAKRAIPALIEALYDGDETSDVSLMASAALVEWGKHSQESVLALVNALHGHLDERIRSAAAIALGDIGATAKGAIPPLIAALHDKSPSVRRSAGQVLATLAKDSKNARVALPALIDALQDADPAVRRTAAYVLRDIGTEARNAVPALITALQKDSTAIVRGRAAIALGHVGKEAAGAISSLTAALNDREAQEPEMEVRYSAAQALGNIASQLEGLDLRRLLMIHRAHARLSALQGIDEAQASTIQIAKEQVRAARRQIFITLCLVLLAGVLLVVATASLSPKVRRHLLLLMGRRWALVTGRCDAVIEVYDQAIVVRLLDDDRPDPPGALSPEWPPSDSLIQDIRQHLAGSQMVRLLTFSEAQFRKPWAHVVGPSRSDRDGRSIMGQLCLGKGGRPRAQAFTKHVAFVALGCARPSELTLGTLNEVEAEIEAVHACFRRWGADSSELNLEATREDVLRAIASADVVHIAAHADPDAIYLANGTITAEDLQPMLVAGQRCRLLVLSACSAGKLDADFSLVLKLVQSGVNVFASLEEVRDFVTRTFFEQAYAQWLPGARVGGIEFGIALREAADHCQQRFQRASHALGIHGESHMWHTSIDAFVLYGDPTLQLQLVVPRHLG